MRKLVRGDGPCFNVNKRLPVAIPSRFESLIDLTTRYHLAVNLQFAFMIRQLLRLNDSFCLKSNSVTENLSISASEMHPICDHQCIYSTTRNQASW